MIANIPFIQASFEKFNQLCFDGVLPPVKITLSKAKSFVGKMEYHIIRDKYGNIVGHSDYVMKISTWFDMPEDMVEDIVIHEMIHYYIAFRNIKDSSVHGNVFKRMMNIINSSYGRHISIRHDSDGTSIARSSGRKRLVCATELDGGRKGITVCTPAMAPVIHLGLKRYYNVRSIKWFISDDPFFESYPLSRKPRIYRISEDDQEQHLRTAKPIYCDGRIVILDQQSVN